MIRFKQRGDFSRLDRYFERIKEKIKMGRLDRFGRKGVQILSAATPRDTGTTAASWGYEILHQNGVVTIAFTNTSVDSGVHVAILLEYGHATRDGGWVDGLHFLEPTIRPLFKEIADDAWREIKDL